MTITVYVVCAGPKNRAADREGWERDQILGVYPTRSYAQTIINRQFTPHDWVVLEFELDTQIFPRDYTTF
jgi:hypothetical protein